MAFLIITGDQNVHQVCTITAYDPFTHFSLPTKIRNRLHTTTRQASRNITTDMTFLNQPEPSTDFLIPRSRERDRGSGIRNRRGSSNNKRGEQRGLAFKDLQTGSFEPGNGVFRFIIDIEAGF